VGNLPLARFSTVSRRGYVPVSYGTVGSAATGGRNPDAALSLVPMGAPGRSRP
jgi:hypothetical protein